MLIKKKWFGLAVEVHASANEQDILSTELYVDKKPIYKGWEANDILDYLENKIGSAEAFYKGNDEYEVMRAVSPKDIKKSLGVKKKKARKRSRITSLRPKSVMSSPRKKITRKKKKSK